MNTTTNRRAFFSQIALAAATFIVAPRVLANACPKEKPEGVKVLELDSAVSKRIEYVEAADSAKAHAKFTAGANCENCQFFQGPREKNGYAPCTMAGMAFVNKCGWCNLYRVNPKKKA